MITLSNYKLICFSRSVLGLTLSQARGKNCMMSFLQSESHKLESLILVWGLLSQGIHEGPVSLGFAPWVMEHYQEFLEIVVMAALGFSHYRSNKWYMFIVENTSESKNKSRNFTQSLSLLMFFMSFTSFFHVHIYKMVYHICFCDDCRASHYVCLPYFICPFFLCWVFLKFLKNGVITVK